MSNVERIIEGTDPEIRIHFHGILINFRTHFLRPLIDLRRALIDFLIDFRRALIDFLIDLRRALIDFLINFRRALIDLLPGLQMANVEQEERIRKQAMIEIMKEGDKMSKSAMNAMDGRSIDMASLIRERVDQIRRYTLNPTPLSLFLSPPPPLPT